MIIATTGHRPHKLGGYSDNPTQRSVKRAIREKLEELKPTKVISGMALGTDQWTTEICVELGIPFIAAIPFKGQESKWPAKSQGFYNHLLTLSAEVVEICSPGYSPDKMQIRNKWMVDKAAKDPNGRLIAVWDHSDGGTANCVRYALSRCQSRPGFVINLWSRITDILCDELYPPLRRRS